MVKEMRVPSSSNSSSRKGENQKVFFVLQVVGVLTNGDRLDLDTILDVSNGSIVGILVGQDALAAESVYEGRSSYKVQ